MTAVAVSPPSAATVTLLSDARDGLTQASYGPNRQHTRLRKTRKIPIGQSAVPAPVNPAVKHSLRAIVVACALVLLVPMPASATRAAPPCWKTLLNDWYDGRIDNVYPIPCYQDAIRHLPTDVKVYSSAAEDIQRALQLAIAHAKNPKAPLPTITSSGPGAQQTTTTAGVAPLPGNK